MLTDLVEIATTLETGGVGIDQDQRDALGAQFRIGFRRNDDDVGILAVGNIGLGAIDDIMIAVLPGCCADTLKVGPCARFGHGDRRDTFAADHFG
mgnify:CR=1 FL=1